MLNVSFSNVPLAAKEKKHKKDKKKSKKKSKKSKEKKEKHDRQASESEGESSGPSDGGGGSDDEASKDQKPPPPQRDEWMTLERSILEPSAEEKDSLDRKQQDAMKKHAEPVMVPGLRVMKEAGPSDEGIQGSRPQVGDGGMSWRMRAQMRAMGVQPTQGMSHPRSMEASGRDSRSDRPPCPHNLNDLKSEKGQMLKPSSVDGGLNRGAARGREGERPRRDGPGPGPANAFSDDGSFLNKFSSMPKEKQDLSSKEKQDLASEDKAKRARNQPPNEPSTSLTDQEASVRASREVSDLDNHDTEAQVKQRVEAKAEGFSDHPYEPQPEPQSHSGVTNQSIAEILRAKLKGLPTPALPPRNTALPPAPQAHRPPAPPSPFDRSHHHSDRRREDHAGSNDRGRVPSGERKMDRVRDKKRGRGTGGEDSSGDDDGSLSKRKGKRKNWEDDEADDDDEDDNDDDEEDDEDGGDVRRREVVHLPLIDAQGRAVKGAFGREAAGQGSAEVPGGSKRQKITQRYDKEGQKQRYFDDDDGVDLDTLVRGTKYGDDNGARGVDDAFAKNVMGKSRFKEKDLDVDDEYDHDGGLEMYESRQKKGGREEQLKRERDRQIAMHNKSSKIEDRCLFCPTSSRRPRHLTVSVAQYAYLMLPDKGRLSPHHCLIVAADHSPSMRQIDDNAWTEVKNFVKCLVQMFGSRGQQCIFIETAMHVKSMRGHAVLECIPVSQKELDKAPAYFKKGMIEAESEWSTHHAKAVIETSAKKGLRESVPLGFPYLYAQFGYGSGMLHVIDDEEKYDVNLGRQVLQGLMGARAEDMNRITRGESLSAQERLVADFKQLWDGFDWTKQLG